MHLGPRGVPKLTRVIGSSSSSCRGLADGSGDGRRGLRAGLEQDVAPALGGHLDAAVVADVRTCGGADALAQVGVVDEAQERGLDLGRGARVDARDAVLDLRVDVGMRDERYAERARFEPAQVALALEQVALR